MGLLFTMAGNAGAKKKKTEIDLNIEYYQFNFISVEQKFPGGCLDAGL